MALPTSVPISFIFLLVTVAACVTSRDPIPPAASAAIAECDRLHQTSDLDSLRRKVVLRSLNGLQRPTKTMLADRSIPNAVDLATINRWAAIRQGCRDALTKVGYESSVNEDIFHKRSNDLMGRLRGGTLTYGKFNIGMARAKLELSKAIAGEDSYFAKGAEIGAKRTAAIAASLPKPDFSHTDPTKSFYNCNVYNASPTPYYADIWVTCY